MALEDTLYQPRGLKWITGLVSAVDTTLHELTLQYAGGTVPHVRYLRGTNWAVNDIVECLSDETRGIIAIGSPFPRTGTAAIWAPRTYMTNLLISGGWNAPASWNFSVPFKCDINVVSTLSFWANAVGMTGYQPLLDGAIIPSWWDHYFNQTGVHMTVGNAFTLRGVAAGTHTFTFSVAVGQAASDGNDRGHISMTMVEVP